MKYHYSDRFFYLLDEAEANRKVHFLDLRPRLRVGADPCPRHRQVGSLAGAAHLSNDNAGVLRRAQREQKSRVEQKGKSSLDFDFSVGIQTAKAWPIDPLVFRSFKLEVSEKLPQG